MLDKSSMQIYAWCFMCNHFHLAIQSGKTTLSEFMRSLLTGYAVNYNKRHKRRGYLFQNRYKSILCDKDEYLLSLIRYIHLNPVKARIISFSQLKKYEWTGHREVVGKIEEALIERDEVLKFFGKTEETAKSAYEEFVKEGLRSKEDFMGGGLIRSVGGLDKVLQMGKDERQCYDERILGDGNFVERVLNEVEKEKNPGKFKSLEELTERISALYKIDKEKIINMKTKDVREPRSVLLFFATKYLGYCATEIGGLLGITQSAASKARYRGMKIVAQKGLLNKL